MKIRYLLIAFCFLIPTICHAQIQERNRYPDTCKNCVVIVQYDDSTEEKVQTPVAVYYTFPASVKEQDRIIPDFVTLSKNEYCEEADSVYFDSSAIDTGKLTDEQIFEQRKLSKVKNCSVAGHPLRYKVNSPEWIGEFIIQTNSLKNVILNTALAEHPELKKSEVIKATVKEELLRAPAIDAESIASALLEGIKKSESLESIPMDEIANKSFSVDENTGAVTCALPDLSAEAKTDLKNSIENSYGEGMVKID